MASSFYKWFIILPIAFVGLPGVSMTGVTNTRSPGNAVLHPFHVSVVEINHNAADKTLEISCKIFTDDFEKVLAKNYQTRIDLINPVDKKAMDSVVKKYVFSHLSLSVDGKPGKLVYVGFERDAEAVFSYVQIDNVPSVKKIDVTNQLMHDMFDDQVNIVHVIVNGNRKSTKLDYPATNAAISF